MRVGLKQVSCPTNTSPARLRKSSAKCLSPLKEGNHFKVIHGGDIEDKENREVQAYVTVNTTYAQTDIVSTKNASHVTKEDLLCEKPSSSYWRAVVEDLERKIDAELETSFTMSLELDKSYEELSDAKERLDLLMDVMNDVLVDEQDKEESPCNQTSSSQ